jgi:hypothetical protein
VAFEEMLDAAGVGLVPENIEQIILTLAAALGLYGIRVAVAQDTKAAAQAVAMVTTPVSQSEVVKQQAVAEAIVDAKKNV